MTRLPPNTIYVFGSNLAGRHGAGCAKAAYQHYGAIWGLGWGRQGQSYAIPTKDKRLQPLSLATIQEHVSTFGRYAEARPELQFIVTAVGCGLAGFAPQDIAPLFAKAPSNCLLPAGWRAYNAKP